MRPRRFFLAKGIAAALLIVVGIFFALNHYIYQEKQGDNLPPEPYRATLAGELVCLPHRDETGPQTDECAFGLKIADGSYYAIDFMLMSQLHPPFEAGTEFTGSGVITPGDPLMRERYLMEGQFSVTNVP